jgi:hypothetical protein
MLKPNSVIEQRYITPNECFPREYLLFPFGRPVLFQSEDADFIILQEGGLNDLVCESSQLQVHSILT